MSEPRLVFRHVDDVPEQLVRSQRHGDRQVGVHLKFMEWSPNRTFIVTHYDPDLVLSEHWHKSDHIIYILKGSVTIGDTECTPGTMVLLEHGAVFGPLIAGPEGTDLLEFYTGDVSSVHLDGDAYLRLLEEKGIVPEPNPVFDPTVATSG